MDEIENQNTSLKELPTKELKLKRLKARKDLHVIHPVHVRVKNCVSSVNLNTEVEKYFSDRSMSSSPEDVNQDVTSECLSSSFKDSSHANSLPSSPLTSESNEILKTYVLVPSSNSPNLEDYDQPLDMSRKGLHQSVSSESQKQHHKQLRPSVITCASALLRTQCHLNDVDHQMCTTHVSTCDLNSQDSLNIKKHKSSDSFPNSDVHPGYRHEIVSGSYDPVIDEHFRRSLGKDYQHVFSESSNSRVSLTVDDHFAKALGEKWFQLQESKNVTVDTVSAHPSSSSQTPFIHQPAEILS